MKILFISFYKEVVVALRDRRTIIASVVIPIIIIPLLLYASDKFSQKNSNNFLKEIHVAIENDNLGYFEQFVSELHNSPFILIDSESPYHDLESQKVDIVVNLDYTNKQVRLNYDSDNRIVLNSLSYINEVISNGQKDVLMDKLNIDKNEDSIISNYDISTISTKPESYNLFKSILILLLPIIIVSSSMTIVANMTVGEKEQHTIESLLCIPTNPVMILGGKLIASWLYSLVAACLSIFGYVLYFFSVDGLHLYSLFSLLSPWIILDVILMALCVVCLSFFVCTNASSVKEAQTKSSVIMIGITIIAMGISSYSLDQLPKLLLFIPLVNNVIGIYASLNKSILLSRYIIQTITTMILIIYTVKLSTKLFTNEKKMFC